MTTQTNRNTVPKTNRELFYDPQHTRGVLFMEFGRKFSLVLQIKTPVQEKKAFTSYSVLKQMH